MYVCEKSLLLEADCLLGFLIEKCFFQSCHRGKKLALLRNPIFYQEIETSHLAACSSAVPWVSACGALRYHCLLVPGFFFLPLTRIPSVAVKGQHWRQGQCYPEIANFAYRLEILVVAGIDATWIRQGGVWGSLH